jgi:hypothetical protein
MRCFLLFALLVLSVGCTWGARTGKSAPYKNVPEESVSEEDEASPDDSSSVDSVSVEDSDVDYVAVGSSRKRTTGVKGVATRRSTGRACKQRLNDPEEIEAACVAAPKEAPSPVIRRPRYVFPEELRTPKAIGRPRQVTMTLPERYAPKDRTHTVAQEYAWATSAMGDMRFTRDGHVSGGWARLVEVMAGTDSAMMREATREMRQTDLNARRALAFERVERQIARARATFVRRNSRQRQLVNTTEEKLLTMFAPAEEDLRQRLNEYVEEDLEELERMWLEVEKWRRELAADDPTGKLAFHKDDESDDDHDDGGGKMPGLVGASLVGLTAVAATRGQRH